MASLMERRTSEGASLRRLFHDQWSHLHQLIQGAREQGAREQRGEPQGGATQLDASIETIVAGTDVRLRGVFHYQDRLRDSARELLEHIDALVAQLPPPLLVSRTTLVEDASSRVLFHDVDFFRDLLLRSRAMRDFHDGRAVDDSEIYAIVSCFEVEKRSLGTALAGDILVGDVLQTRVSFVDHKVLAVADSEPALRSALRQTLLDIIVDQVRTEIARIRHARREAERADGRWDPTRSVENPQVYLHLLRELLAAPRQLLALDKHQVAINRMGVKQQAGDLLDTSSAVDTLDLCAVAIGDRRPRILCMTRYPAPRRGTQGE